MSEPEYSFLSLQKGAIPHGYQVPRCRFVRGPFHAKSECFQILHPHLSICPSACGLMKVTGVADPRWSTARSMPIALPSRPPRGFWPVDFQSAERLRASRMCIMVSRLSYHQQGGMLIWLVSSFPIPLLLSEAEPGRASVVPWPTAHPERNAFRMRTQLHRKTVLTAAARTPGTRGGGTDTPNARRDNPTRSCICWCAVTIDN